MEPFSTSVFKVLIWIHATTTGICTGAHSTWDHSQSFNVSTTPSYSLTKLIINGRVSGIHLSAIHFQG